VSRHSADTPLTCQSALLFCISNEQECSYGEGLMMQKVQSMNDEMEPASR
jgi:hypothetical protein